VTAPSNPTATTGVWERFAAAVIRAFHAYARWLAGISWKRFFLLSILLLVAAALLREIPPFTWRITRSLPSAEEPPRRAAKAPKKPARSGETKREARGEVEIKIGPDGVRILRSPAPQKPAAEPSPEGEAAGEAGSEEHRTPQTPDAPNARSQGDTSSSGVQIILPPGADREKLLDTIGKVLDRIEGVVADEVDREMRGATRRTTTVRVGEFLPQLAMLFIVASAILKMVYAGRVQAERKAAAAEEAAGAESLRRQVVEARMAAMQAQVEPHFLFNTLASIDHLIEVDPSRASQMQKNLIALLRASMPSMREGSTSLGRELQVVRPYLEILKVRMQERLRTELDVGEGLYSAEFPPMMLQSLVENAIKHGLEPKPDGGSLSLAAHVAHGKLTVTVADTGVGFGRAATAGTGVGLSSIRERLKLLYGSEAELKIADNAPTGTRVTVVVPYRIADGNRQA